eukprot:7826414-Pyramimonas_sp.AAC.1
MENREKQGNGALVGVPLEGARRRQERPHGTTNVDELPDAGLVQGLWGRAPGVEAASEVVSPGVLDQGDPGQQ